MPKKDAKPTLIRFGVWASVLLAGAGFWFFLDFESRKARDVERIVQLGYLQNALQRYYLDHVAFPSAKQPVDLNSDSCLGSGGFDMLKSKECIKKPYAYRFVSFPNEVFMYTPLQQDGKTLCTTPTGCPWYTVRFLLETNSIYPVGKHNMTPTGIQ